MKRTFSFFISSSHTMKIKFLLLIITINALSISVLMAQKTTASVYMLNGEVYRGEIIALASDVLLIKYDEQIFSLDRKNVRYVFGPTKASKSSSNNKAFTFKPFDKKWATELTAGLTWFTPFNLSMGFTEWYKVGERWSVGAGVSLDFFEYAMVKYNLHVRRYRPHNDYLRGYIDAQAGMSAGASSFIQDNEIVDDIELSPVFQSSVGAGIFIDTGIGLAFTGETGLSLFRYNLKETFFNDISNSISHSEILNVGIYFQGGFIF